MTARLSAREALAALVASALLLAVLPVDAGAGRDPEPGIAAAALGLGSMAPVEALTEVMSAGWRAIGLRWDQPRFRASYE